MTMQNFQLLDEIQTTEKTLTGVVDLITTKYVSFYDLSMNEDPKTIQVVLLWPIYFSHIRFSVFKSLYFTSLKIPSPVLLNKKTIVSGIPAANPKPKRKVERIQLPDDAVVVDFAQHTLDH